VGLLAIILAACGVVRSIGGDPVKTSLPQNFQNKAGATAVAICYVDGDPKAPAIVTAVRELCKEPGSTVAFHSNDLVFNDCPMMKKRRAVYFCTAPALKPGAAAPGGAKKKGPPEAGPLRFPQY
jgi:hypothetical protein